MPDDANQVRTIEQEIVLKAPPERVFRALTDPAELTRWFMHHSELDLRPGGALRFSWDDFGTMPGRVVAVDPPRRFVFAWIEIPDVGETTIAIDLEPAAAGTRLRLVHTGFLTGDEWDRVYRDTVDGWPKELANLRAWIEEGRTRPLPAVLARPSCSTDRTTGGDLMDSVEPRPILISGRTIEREIVIAAPPERVFRALTEPGELERWFATTATGEARPGEAFRFFWEGEGQVDGRYLDVVSPGRLVYEWHNPQGVIRITILLSAEAGGARLRLKAEGYGDGEDWDALYNGESDGWGPLLGALKKWVETGESTTWAPGAP